MDHHSGEGEDIAGSTDLLPQDLFRGCVRRGAEGLAGPGEDGALDGAGDAEVDDLRSAR